jgi:cell division protein FtsW (lipid II flippase)
MSNRYDYKPEESTDFIFVHIGADMWVKLGLFAVLIVVSVILYKKKKKRVSK